ncbi:MAG: AzlD domain-containing protein [Chloroflexota bacterium]
MNGDFWPAIAISGIVVYATRLIGLVAVPPSALQPWLAHRLKFVPTAILSALVAPNLMTPMGLQESPILLAAALTALASGLSRQPFIGLLVGLITVSVFRAVI